MPTNRRRRTHGRTVLTLSSFGLSEQLRFLLGWRPPLFPAERGLWPTWASYFVDYDAIRDEFLGSEMVRRSGRTPFPDAIRTEALQHAGEVYEAHRHASLLHSHWYAFGDEHAHNAGDGRDLGPAVEVRDRSVWPATVEGN